MNKKLRSKYDKCLFKSIDIKNLLLYNVFPKLKTHLSNELIFCDENMSKAVRSNNLKTLKQQAHQFFVQNKCLSVCYDEFAYIDILCCWQKQKDCNF